MELIVGKVNSYLFIFILIFICVFYKEKYYKCIFNGFMQWIVWLLYHLVAKKKYPELV